MEKATPLVPPIDVGNAIYNPTNERRPVQLLLDNTAIQSPIEGLLPA